MMCTLITLFLTAVITILLSCHVYIMVIRWLRSCNYPPGPRAWPVVGNLFQLGVKPHLTLTQWRKDYGDVYSLRLGYWYVVVVSGRDAIRAALVKQAPVFSDRPPFITFQRFADGHSLSFRRYDGTYMSHRHVAQQMIHNAISGRHTPIQNIFERNIIRLIDEATAIASSRVRHPPTSVDKDELTIAIKRAIGGVMFSLCYGDEANIDDDELCLRLVTGENPSTELFGAGNQVDLLPWWHYVFTRRSLERTLRRMRDYVTMNQRHYDERSERFHGDPPHDFLDVLITGQKFASGETNNWRQYLYHTIVEFFSAGTDTSSTTLQWLLLYMAAYPDKQEKVRQEIHKVVGDNRLPTIADRCYLPYTEAVILETLRIVCLVPFALPHYAARSTELCGYQIPENTLVLVNLFSVCRDEKLWTNPQHFRPERFLLTSVTNGAAESSVNITIDNRKADLFLPFGMGRRRCVGEQLGRAQVLVFFASLVQRCRIGPLHPSQTKVNLEPMFGDIMKPRNFNIALTRL